MTWLGMLLAIIVTIMWGWPEKFGKWLREVKNGYDKASPV